MKYVKKILPKMYIETDKRLADRSQKQVLLSETEYDYLNDRAHLIDSEEKQIYETVSEKEQRLKKKMDVISSKAKKEINRLSREMFEYQELAGKLEQELHECEQRLKTQENLNENLKRISRERANSKRGLQTKKTHKGYVLLETQQMEISVRTGARQIPIPVRVWRSTIQSPYDATIPLASILGEIERDLTEDIFKILGIQGWVEPDSDGSYRKFRNSDGTEVCGVYRRQYRGNFKSGFWEIYVYHTMEISVPEELITRK